MAGAMNLYLDDVSREALQREAERTGAGSVSRYLRALGAFLSTPAASDDDLEVVRERVRVRLRDLAKETHR